MAKLPYFVIVPNEKCANTIRQFFRHEVGLSRVKYECKKAVYDISLVKDYPIVDIVIADRSFQYIVVGARTKYTRSVKKVRRISIAFPIDLEKTIRDISIKFGINLSETIRRMIMYVISNNLVEEALTDEKYHVFS